MLLQSKTVSLAAQLTQMAIVQQADGQTLIRFWCTRCNTAEPLVESSDAMMRVKKDKNALTRSILASVEHVALTRLMVQDKGDHLEFRYVF